PGRSMNASFVPNIRADTSRMSLSVSTLSPSARERTERLARSLPIWRVVREQDGLHVKSREPADRLPRERHVVGEERVRERDLPFDALQKVADDHESVAGRVEADASGGVTRRVEDAETAKDRQLVALVHRLSVRRRPCEERDDRAGREVRDHFTKPNA